MPTSARRKKQAERAAAIGNVGMVGTPMGGGTIVGQLRKQAASKKTAATVGVGKGAAVVPVEQQPPRSSSRMNRGLNPNLGDYVTSSGAAAGGSTLFTKNDAIPEEEEEVEDDAQTLSLAPPNCILDTETILRL